MMMIMGIDSRTGMKLGRYVKEIGEIVQTKERKRKDVR